MAVRRLLAIGTVVASLCGSWSRVQLVAADETAPASTEVSSAQIAAWVEALDAPAYKDREAAMRNLSEAGLPAVGPLSKAAEDHRLEVINRSMEVLKRFYQSKDAKLQAATKEVLQKLAKSTNGPTARRANDILMPAQGDAPRGAPNVPQFQAVPFGGAIPIQVQAIQAPGIQVQARGGNGEKHIEVQRDGKKIKIDETKEGITVTLTEKVDGKEKTTTGKAKNVEDLKKNHPELHKLYKEYGEQAVGGGGVIIGGNAGIQIQIQAGGPAILPFLPPAPAPAPAPVPAIAPAPIAAPPGIEQLNQAAKGLKESLEKLKKISGGEGAKPEGLADVTKQLEDALKHLEEAKKQLEIATRINAIKNFRAVPAQIQRAVPIQVQRAVPAQIQPAVPVPAEKELPAEAPATEAIPQRQPLPQKQPVPRTEPAPARP